MDFAWLYFAGLAVALAGLATMVVAPGPRSFTSGVHVLCLGLGVVIAWVGVMYLTGPVPRP